MRTAPVRANQPVTISPNDPTLLRNVAVAQAVEALGHDIMLDMKSLLQIADLGNAAVRGIKSRFTHPGLSSDGLGRFLGRLRNFRIDHTGVPTVRADLKISDVSRKSPDGDLGGYVLDLAGEDPHAFGMSVVISVEPHWALSDGSEIPAIDQDGNRVRRPDSSLYDYPVARVFELHAADIVDEPAANRDGIFSAFSRTTNELSSALYEEIDNALTYYGVSPARAYEFFMAYFQARGVAGNAYALPHTVSAEGLIRLSRSSMEESMYKDQEEIQLLEGDAPQLDLSLYESLIAQVASQVSASADSDRLDRLEQAVADIAQQVMELSRNVTIIGMAVAGLRGEPTVTAKVGGEQAMRAAPRHTLSAAAASIPSGLGFPPDRVDYTEPTNGPWNGTPEQNALRLAEMRGRGGR